jgi:hypothetical protein
MQKLLLFLFMLAMEFTPGFKVYLLIEIWRCETDEQQEGF